MEQRKSRNRRGKHQQPEFVQTTSTSENAQDNMKNYTPGIKKLTQEDYDYRKSDKSQFANLKRETQDITKQLPDKAYAKRHVVSNWAKYEEIQDDDDNTISQNFESLFNAPVSQGGHFVFKSEKNWGVEVSKYSELFSLDVKNLAAAVNCIPFTDYVEVESKYFSEDELERIHTKAEKAKSIYDDILNTCKLPKTEDKLLIALKECIEKDVENSCVKIDTNSKTDSVIQTVALSESEEKKDLLTDDSEEDIDFLLSLKEPVKDNPATVPSSAYTACIEEPKTPAAVATPQSVDLEKWLDSVLDE